MLSHRRYWERRNVKFISYHEMIMFPVEQRHVGHEVPQSSLWIIIHVFLLFLVCHEYRCVWWRLQCSCMLGNREHAYKHTKHSFSYNTLNRLSAWFVVQFCFCLYFLQESYGLRVLFVFSLRHLCTSTALFSILKSLSQNSPQSPSLQK